MSFESLLPKLFRCPECATELYEIVYGMLAGPPKANQVAGGCEWSDEAPTKVCPKCKWEGALGGRSWPIEFTRRTQIFDESAPDNVRNEQRDYNLGTMTNEELFELGRGIITARFELVHRGLDAEDIDDYYDRLDDGDARSWPLIRKDACFIFYDSETQLVDQVCTYSAQRTMHEFQYLRAGFEEWEFTETLSDFQDVVFGMESPALQVWIIDLDHNHEDKDDDSEAFHYGSEAIKAMLAGSPISQEDLAQEGSQYEEPIYWPHWFDPGAMLNYLQNRWLQR